MSGACRFFRSLLVPLPLCHQKFLKLSTSLPGPYRKVSFQGAPPAHPEAVLLIGFPRLKTEPEPFPRLLNSTWLSGRSGQYLTAYGVTVGASTK